MRFGYGTNGFADHRLPEALDVIAGLGYVGVGLTLDHGHLDPMAPDLARRTAEVGRLLADRDLAVVVETGARYVLDPARKHSPTLLHDSAGAARRIALLERAVDVAAELGAEAVSFWSGTVPADVSPGEAWNRLVAACGRLAEYAGERGVRLGFEPEPGMLVGDLAGYLKLRAEVGNDVLGLTLDIGHLRCNEPQPPPDVVAAGAPYLVNVQIDDMRRGVHEHLEFGTGEIDFPPVLAALRESGYDGLVAVELPRHSHAAPLVARRSIDFLRSAEEASHV
ncbi:sugar phosphate isomerase/epimerase family protein [Kribbella catacumbae]|uniref:sugar phosphate isomerase/epimerase family protein n=1 Tax=Kribbella catacumbae TaxID=460086 RepID=UPI00037E50F3|nr:sugar phosphate isomerase/epimerase family protein [Kribbella catacumbae]